MVAGQALVSSLNTSLNTSLNHGLNTSVHHGRCGNDGRGGHSD